jgi:hypothetical protein
MVDASDVRRLAMLLPDVVEDESGTQFQVQGTGFAWPYPERVHPKRARVERRDIFVVRVADEDDKQALLAGEPEKFFTTDHYDGYPAVLVRLDAIDVDELAELLTDAHEAARRKKRRARRPRP